MENNWKDKITTILYNKLEHPDYIAEISHILGEIIESHIEFGNLVFEATKKECIDKAEILPFEKGDTIVVVNKESISNINKPNL